MKLLQKGTYLLSITVILLWAFKTASLDLAFPNGPIWIAILTLTVYVILSCVFRRVKRNIILKTSLRRIDRMTGEEFEKWLKYYFEKKGYKASLTSKSGDYGADLILKRRGEKTVVQAKRYKSRVGIEAVQQALGAGAYYNAKKSIVVTNSYFTSAAKALAEKAGVELIDRDLLFQGRR